MGTMTETETARPRPETETAVSGLETVRETETVGTVGHPAVRWTVPAVPVSVRETETGDRETETALAGAAHYVGGAFARARQRRAARRKAERQAIALGAAWELELARMVAAGECAAEEAGLSDSTERWHRFAAGWPQIVLAVVVASIAATGQSLFAQGSGAAGVLPEIFGIDPIVVAAPAVLDLSVLALYGRGMYVAAVHKASPWLCWAAGTGIGLFSVYTNTLHKGALFFAGSSAVLLVVALVGMITKYRGLPHVQERREHAAPRLLTSSLALVNRKLAQQAFIIARCRPVASIVAERRAAGQRITERDLVIRVAGLWLDIFTDRAVAETTVEKIGAEPSGRTLFRDKNGAARREWRAKYDRALRLAELTAWDAVDRELGLPVPEREGFRVSRISYEDPEPPSRPKPRPTRSVDVVPDDASDLDDYVAPARERVQRRRALPEAPVSPAPAPAAVTALLADLGTHADGALRADVHTDAMYVDAVLRYFDGQDGREHWATMPHRVRKGDLADATRTPERPNGTTGSKPCIRVAHLFDRLRLAHEAAHPEMHAASERPD